MTNRTSLYAMKCLPQRRIRCATTGRIVVGNQEFRSASEALLAYLQQFDAKQRTRKQQDAYELLLSKQARQPQDSILHTRQLDKEIQQRLQRMKMQRMKQTSAAGDSRRHGSALRQEVEDALSRSANLLQHINDDDTASLKCVSDIGSLTTEALLAVDPYSESKTLTVAQRKEETNRHIYSYRTPRARSRTIDSIPQPASQLTKPSGRTRRLSIESIAPVVKSQRPSVRDRFSHVDHNRSRSAPPLPSRIHPSRHASLLQRHPSWVDDLDSSVSTVTMPSWVKNLEGDMQSDSEWNKHKQDLNSNEIPKWVEAAENLNISGYSDLLQDINRKKKKVLFSKTSMTHNNTTGFSDSLPGLNFSDLNTSEVSDIGKKRNSISEEIHAYSQQVQALEEERNNILNGKENLHRVNGHSSPKQKLANNPYIDAMYLELSRSSQLQTSLDIYLEDLDRKTSASPVKNNPEAEKRNRKPRCSSIETCSTAAGREEIKSDITGASPINKHSHLSVTGVSDDLPFIPTPAKPTSRLNPSSTDRLDGANQKTEGSSKHKEHQKSPTLTGSQQPGSMEALKNMLFKLQAEESSTKGKELNSVHTEGPVSPLSLPALKDYNFVAEPGGHSLERALVHLNRLKTLVHSGAVSTGDQSSVSSVSASTTSLLNRP